ncbi:hypothetical protein GCM10028798_26770 [Humibacter antri]
MTSDLRAELQGDDGEPFSVQGTAVPMRRERLPVLLNAERVFETVFSGERLAFWLDAGVRATTGFSYLGAASAVRPSWLLAGETLVRLLGDERVPVAGTFEAALRSWLHERQVAIDRSDVVTGACPLGWIGWLGYEYGARRLGVATESSRYPDAAMLAADRVVEIDHATGRAGLWFLDDADGRAWAVAMGERLRAISEATEADDDACPSASPHEDPLLAERPEALRPSEPSWRHTDHDYLHMIEECQASIRAGDAYQLCLTNEVQVSTPVDPVDVYKRMRRISHAVHGAFVRIDDVCVLSASPELFLQVHDGVAVTRPVKGTRRRGASQHEDAVLKQELGEDPKERAENLMIVDLMRNDLGRVARVGGVCVPELLAVETHTHVHQLVSTVRAELALHVDALDVLHACFPAGSMTGAPKLSAMDILHELEGGPRGVYSGCLGRLGLDGSAEFAMVIRTIVMTRGVATIGTGGGITALSVPENELAETRLKAAALLAALGLH